MGCGRTRRNTGPCALGVGQRGAGHGLFGPLELCVPGTAQWRCVLGYVCWRSGQQQEDDDDLGNQSAVGFVF